MLNSKLKIQDEDVLTFYEMMQLCDRANFQYKFPDYRMDAGLFFQKNKKEKFLIYTNQKFLLRKKLNFSKCKVEEDFTFLPYREIKSTLDYTIKVKRKDLKFKCEYATKKDSIELTGKIKIPNFSEKIFNLNYNRKFTKNNFIINSKLYKGDLLFDCSKYKIDINYLNKIIEFFSEKFIFYSSTKDKRNYTGIYGTVTQTAPIYFYNKNIDTEVWLMHYF